jgi:hypothetical protein
LSSAERRVEAANQAVRATFDAVYRAAKELDDEIDECSNVLDCLDRASFQLQQGEAGVSVVQAKWLKDGEKEGPRGILFLTDRRLLFEQREKIATKKFLFVTTESEEVQELQWEAPIGALLDADASERRRAIVVKKELLSLEFKRPAEVREVLLEIGADSATWDALIARVSSGDIEQERVGSSRVEALETTVGAPSKCPGCGAALDLTVTKGMVAIKCSYCGVSVPLTANKEGVEEES